MEGTLISDYNTKESCKLLIIKEDGSREIYAPSISGFVKVQDIPAPATADHSHPNLDKLDNIVTLLTNGLTGTKTVGAYKLTFNHGVLTGFEPV